MFTNGFKRHIGNKSMSTAALQDRHIWWIDDQLESLYQASQDPSKRIEACRIAAVNLLGFLGWLRAGEVYLLQWMDITLIILDKAAAHDFPQGIGAVFIDLLHKTKGDQAKRANLILAFSTFVGLILGRWIQQLWQALDGPEAKAYSFRKPMAADGLPIIFATSICTLF
jgi:hypothetical protein